MPYGKGLHTVRAQNGVTVGLASDAHWDDVETALRYIATAESGEPLFVIRGRDALAVPALAHYYGECNRHGLRSQASRVDDHLGRFHRWQAENAKLTHLPDPIPEPESVPVDG